MSQSRFGPARSRHVALAAAIAAGVLSSGSCLAQVVTDGNSSFTLDPSATFVNTNGATIRTGATGGSGSVFTTGGLTTTDHLFQTWWWYRVNGVNTREFALSGRTGGSVAATTIMADYTEPEGFTAQLKYTLTDGPDTPTPAGNVGLSCEIVNTGASPLDIAVFCYTDFDVSATIGVDGAVLLEPGRIELTDSTTQAKAQFLGVNPNAYQVGAFSAFRGTLADAVITNLNNTGLPFTPADFTGAFQWNLVIPVGGRQTIRGALAINQSAVAPAGGPACIADFNGVGGVTVQDVFDFLTAWFNNAPNADVNGVGGITVQDVFDFLTAWFNGCP